MSLDASIDLVVTLSASSRFNFSMKLRGARLGTRWMRYADTAAPQEKSSGRLTAPLLASPSRVWGTLSNDQQNSTPGARAGGYGCSNLSSAPTAELRVAHFP